MGHLSTVSHSGSANLHMSMDTALPISGLEDSWDTHASYIKRLFRHGELVLMQEVRID